MPAPYGMSPGLNTDASYGRIVPSSVPLLRCVERSAAAGFPKTPE